MSFYDHFYSGKVSRAGHWIELKENKVFYQIVNNILPLKGRTLLEIGVGEGHFAQLCLNSQIKYSGIEGNSNQAKHLIERGLNVTHAIIPPFPIKDKIFDIVYCANILEHMNDAKTAQELIKECYNHLSPGGLVIVIAPNFQSVQRDFYNADYTHNYVTTPRRVEQLLGDNHFDIVYSNCFAGPFFGLRRYPIKIINKLYPWKLFDKILGRFFHKDFFYKIKLTFNENLFIVGQKISVEQSDGVSG